MTRAPQASRRIAAFSLVEVMIVVLMLAIVAALVVPQFSNAASTARESALREDLRYLRTQIIVYRSQHGGVMPGYPNGDTTATPTAEAFVEQLTRYSDARGNTSAMASAEYRFGPYLSEIPLNPVRQSASVQIIIGDFPSEPQGSAGWLYQPSTGRVAANASGVDAEGVAFFDY